MIAERLHELIKSLEMLPPLPVVVQRLLEVAADKNSSAQDMGDVISTDQGFAAKLLKLVNSSFYGFSRQISTLSRAVVILGYDAVQSLALGLGAFDAFVRNENLGPLNHRRFWQHSLAAATAGKLLAEHADYGPPEEGFVAGLLHDAGRLFLAQCAPRALEILFEEAKKRPEREITEIEQELLGIDHCVLGGNIFKHWKFPEPLLWAVRRHHNIETDSVGKVAQLEAITYLADSMARIRCFGSSGNDAFPAAPRQLMNRLKLNDSMLMRVLLEMDGEMEKTAALLRTGACDIFECRKAGEEHSEKILLISATPRQIRPAQLVFESMGYHTAVRTAKALTHDIVKDAGADILVIDASDGAFDLDSLNSDTLAAQHSVIMLPSASGGQLPALANATILIAPFTVEQLRNTIDPLNACANG